MAIGDRNGIRLGLPAATPSAAEARPGATTLRINRIWWEHLAPKAAHRRLPEIDALLRRWCASGYGAEWLAVAMREGGVFRVRPGQLIPALHLVSLGDGPSSSPPRKTSATIIVLSDPQRPSSGVPSKTMSSP